MNPKYDMKEYSKFPKIKSSQWKNVLICYYHVIIVTKNKGCVVDRFGNEDVGVFSA